MGPGPAPLFLRGESRNGFQGFTLQNIPVQDDHFPENSLLFAAWANPDHLTVRIGPDLLHTKPVTARIDNDRVLAPELEMAINVIAGEQVSASLRIVPFLAGAAIWLVEIDVCSDHDLDALVTRLTEALAAVPLTGPPGATVLRATSKTSRVIGIVVENFGSFVPERAPTVPTN